MSREHASVAPGRARTRVRRKPAPVGSHGSRAAARPATRDRAQSAGPAGTKAALSLAALVLLAVVLLRAGVLHATAMGPWAAGASGSRPAASPVTQTVDPRLLLTPRTVTQAAAAGGVGVALTVGPLLPGSNRFELRLAQRGRPLAGARVFLVVRMTGMAMRPITLPLSEAQPGRYTARGPLAMFGQWQVTTHVDRPGRASLRHRFTVSVDLPRGLLTAPATRGAPRQESTKPMEDQS